jgi:hypothetical protein
VSDSLWPGLHSAADGVYAARFERQVPVVDIPFPTVRARRVADADHLPKRTLGIGDLEQAFAALAG